MLIAASVPVKVSALAVPPTTTPLPDTAVKLPAGTESVMVTLPAPASTSPKLKPVSLVATSSVTAMLAGDVMVGVSLTAITLLIVTVAGAEIAPTLSVTVKVIGATGPL